MSLIIKIKKEICCKYSYEPVVPHNRSQEGDISFHLTLQPLVFLRLLTWGSLAPSPFSFAALKAMRFPML